METEETIVTDISEEKEELEQTPEPTGRDAVMQAILNGRVAEQEEEAAILEGPEEPEEELEDTDHIEDEFTTVKVNGRVYEVETEKVEQAGGVEAYQRNAAASEKQRQFAEEEARRKADLDRREKQLAEMERKLLNPDPPPQNDNGEFGSKFAENVFDDPEAVATQMNELNSRTQKAERVAEELRQKMLRQEEKQLAKEKREQDKVVQHFWTKHKAIAVDPEFTAALNARTGTIAEMNPGFTQKQVVDAAADEVYQKFHISRDSEEKPIGKDNGKRPVRTAPRASSRKPPTPEVKQKTPEEKVRELAKFRSYHG